MSTVDVIEDGAVVSGLVDYAANGISFADMVAGADVVRGHGLTKDKAALVGVPFVITGVTYRDGVKRGKEMTNYLSIEIMIADKATLEKAKAKGLISEDCPFDPEESIVFNDGSTGIARQLTAYLHDKGVINVGEIGANPNGPMGESPYDRYRANWVSGANGDEDIHFRTLLLLPRGLRESEYEAEATGEMTTTYYIG